MGESEVRTKKILTATQCRALLTHVDGWIATGFGSGFVPRAPGTLGSAVALIPWWFLLRQLPMTGYLIILVIASAIGVWACDMAGRRIGVDDHRALVWDEFVGQWIALFLAPAGWAWMLAGFALFRLFDVWKPWPVRVADRAVHGGFGVMLDDVLAGLYALLVLQAAALLLGVAIWR